MKKTIFIFLFSIISLYPKYNYNFINKNSYISTNNLIGKIKIPNTKINYDIYQGKDNKYYLNHKGKKENIYGSIFLDYRNNSNDKKLLIYGHNSKTLEDAYFKELEKYKEYNFYKDNSYIYLTINNNNYIYKIFSINIIPKDDYTHTKINFSKDEFFLHIKRLKTNSLYNTNTIVSKNDYIITLQTCNYNPDNTYLLINAKRVEINEKVFI